MSDFETAQRLWAPWRMEFIRAPKEPGCFLCRIAGGAAHDAENHVVGRRGTALLLLNRYPYNGGHLMAAPVRHVATLAELAPDAAKLGAGLRVVREVNVSLCPPMLQGSVGV